MTINTENELKHFNELAGDINIPDYYYTTHQPEANHKGQPCSIKPTILCQEGYCSGCYIAITEHAGS